MAKSQLVFHPIISPIQRIALYETKARFYLIGSNNTQTRFRVLKIDRTDYDLNIVDDKFEYNKQEIHELVNMIDNGNRSARSGGVAKLVSAFGIIGFVRFLEGYYIVLVTKRRRVAVIGYHSIYKIEDSKLIYIPNESPKPINQNEQRYVRMFQALDLSTNFYFSYSYDLSHSLQVNMAPPRRLMTDILYPNFDKCTEEPKESSTSTSDSQNSKSKTKCNCKLIENNIIDTDASNDDLYFTCKSQLEQRCQTSNYKQSLEYGIRPTPEWRFVWNYYLLSPILSHLHPDWILYVTHGFVDQSNMPIFGRSVYLTLIGRRSTRYAGTRFLKRGANCNGDSANEVETEQIVHDSMVSSLSSGRFSSFVQMRGSIPGQWSQDISKIVPKPAISVDLYDPYCQVAGNHFNQLLERYGSPIVIVNLVKEKEKRKHESFLTEEISGAVKYLNQFLPPEFKIQYFHIDMARMNKGKESRVLDRLADIARAAIKKVGIFVSVEPEGEKLGIDGYQGGTLQTGIVRVNCVDCLDRTNTAQFAVGKCVLEYQLCALGLLDKPLLEFDSDCIRLLECLYEDHGDMLAMQYGGSQLVHRIKTYRKTAPWASQGNDIMQTLSRYYSNTFSDAEKQNTMNLFLGLFIPYKSKHQLWEVPIDYYLHHPEAMKYKPIDKKPLTKWWSDSVMKFLPLSCTEMMKSCTEIIGLEGISDGVFLEMIDVYQDYHRPFEISTLQECYGFKVRNLLREIAMMPPYTINWSPFVVRGRWTGQGKGSPSSKNPALTAYSSDSNNDSSSDDEMSNSISSTRQISPATIKEIKHSEELLDFERWDNFTKIKRGKRIELKEPSRPDLILYKRYVNTGKKSSQMNRRGGNINLTVASAFNIDTTFCVIPPTVTKSAKEVYRQYVDKANGPPDPAAGTMRIYRDYVNCTLSKKKNYNY